ncbi:MAG: CDP-glycerol glycerophosphotransferase family protein [Lacisediminihabitans sp.]
MDVRKDIKTASQVVSKLMRSRSARRELARRAPGLPRPAAGSIQVAVYFADSTVNLYQVRQWYAPLAKLAETWPVAIISRSPTAAIELIAEAPIPVVYRRSIADLEGFIAEQDIRIVFYVNQNSKNFQMMRYGRVWHVFINHGESDKMYMTTNQFKAYDYSLIAGEAARERLSRKLWNFDVDRRTLMIGRPQADHFAGPVPYSPDGRTVVLYAPTWEGDRGAAAYSSVVSHGEALTAAVLASPAHRLIYRPHPRTGVLDREFKRANESIIAAIAAANSRDSTAQHVFDDGPTLGWQLAAADVAITDISAMVYDRLAVGKPLIVTRPVAASADVDANGYLGAAEWLDSAEAGNILARVEQVQHSENAKKTLEHWVTRHFGDTTPGVTTERFHAAVATLISEWEKHALVHVEDRKVSETDPFDDDEDD